MRRKAVLALAWALSTIAVSACGGGSQSPQGIEATAEATPAISRPRLSASVYMERGEEYRRKGDYENAIESYDEAIRLDPENADAYIKRGNNYYRLTQYQRAIDDYDKALLLDPGNRTATAWRDRNMTLISVMADQYFNSAYDYADKGDHQKAIENYNEAIRLNPQDAMAYNYRGWT